MEISILICDHCEKILHEGVNLNVESYRIEGDKNPRTICSNCQNKPFKRVPQSPKGLALKQLLRLLLSSKDVIQCLSELGRLEKIEED